MVFRAFLVFAAVACSLALAQSPLGTVAGIAVDPTNSPVPAAELTLTNTRTGVKQSAQTNGAGTYSFPNLTPGTYKLEASVSGFRKIETGEFPVDAYRTVRQDLRLELGTASSEVTVAGTTSTVIQVDNPSISEGLTTKQILEMPEMIEWTEAAKGEPDEIGELDMEF